MQKEITIIKVKIMK